jgi:hypothetical protein
MKDPKRPQQHGDFDDPRVFQTILCYVDPSAFIDQKACPSSPTMFNSNLELPKIIVQPSPSLSISQTRFSSVISKRFPQTAALPLFGYTPVSKEIL